MVAGGRVMIGASSEGAPGDRGRGVEGPADCSGAASGGERSGRLASRENRGEGGFMRGKISSAG